MPTGSNETQRLVIAGINVKNTGVTALFTPAQQQFFVSKINCVIAAASGLVVGPTGTHERPFRHPCGSRTERRTEGRKCAKRGAHA